ncbi:hypothetical protein [Thioalkalivibrio sp. HK1]|uniref:hypothetical protein n=1 Tax=Thioalkalivibrio sp. HK1 TaxID=1469245 RepID=UPI0012DF7D5C|nr:hypothetical protein [Thioalkalivibrio sp. HK1]
MKKIAMIVMLFGFVGAAHAGSQEATGQVGIQSSVDMDMTSMIQGASSVGSHGAASLKPEPEPEYDIKLGEDSICDTDAYSCFHLADNDATTIRTEETQTAFYFVAILCALYCGK